MTPNPLLRLCLALCTVSSLAGCATDSGPAAGPFPVGGGVYSTGGSNAAAGGPHDESYQRAIRFCFDQGKQLLRTDEAGAARPGRQTGEVLFRCVGPDEPGWKQPVG